MKKTTRYLIILASLISLRALPVIEAKNYNITYPDVIEGYACPFDDDKNGTIDRLVYRLRGHFNNGMNQINQKLYKRSKYEYVGLVFGDAIDTEKLEHFETDIATEDAPKDILERYKFYVIKSGVDFLSPQLVELRAIQEEKEFNLLCATPVYAQARTEEKVVEKGGTYTIVANFWKEKQ